MRFLKNFILILTAVLSALVLLAAASWFYPGLFLNEKTVPKLVSWVFPRVHLDWEHLEIDVKSLSFWRKEVSILSQDFCAKRRKRFDICLKAVRLRAEADLEDRRRPGLRIREISLLDEKIIFEPQNEKKQENERGNISDILASIQYWLKRVELHTVKIHLNDLDFGNPDAAGMRISFLTNPNPSDPLRFGFELRGANRVSVQGEIKKENYLVTGAWKTDLQYHGEKERISVRASLASRSLVVVDEPIRASVSGESGYGKDRKDRLQFHTDGVFQLNERAIRAQVERLRVEDVKSGIAVSADGCQLGARLDIKRFGSGASLDCPKNRLDLKSLQKRELVRGYLPETLHFELRAGHEENRGRRMIFGYRFRFSPVDNELMDFRLLSSGYIGVPFTVEETGIRELDFSFGVKQYAELAGRISRAFDVLIPAPFHQLQGAVRISSIKKDWSPSRHPKIPLAAQVNLTGSQTVLDAGFRGEIENVFVRPHLSGRVLVDNISVRLPSLDPIYGFPKLKNDPRLKQRLRPPTAAEELRPGEKTPFTYHVEVATVRPDSMKLYYHLAEPYVPVALDLVLTPERVAGTLETRDFSLEYLKKKVDIQRFAMRLGDPPSESKIDAVVTAERGAYQLQMEVIGSVAYPRIELTSQPDLSRDEILALMLYNKMPSRLTEGQNRDASQLNAALNDHAIGLLGAWAMSSVPIDSLSYNSATKTYAAQVNLPSQVTLSIGSDWENLTGVELAKSFGLNWFLVSSYEPRQEVSEGRMMLEWRKSY